MPQRAKPMEDHSSELYRHEDSEAHKEQETQWFNV